jgi:hypothetical protein
MQSLYSKHAFDHPEMSVVVFEPAQNCVADLGFLPLGLVAVLDCAMEVLVSHRPYCLVGLGKRLAGVLEENVLLG